VNKTASDVVGLECEDERLLGEETLKLRFRAELRQTLTLLFGVRRIELDDRVFHRVRLHQNNRLYVFLIDICRFFYEGLQPQERLGQYRFGDVDRDERRMRWVLENSSAISTAGAKRLSG
jgi:hypothetical protein